MAGQTAPYSRAVEAIRERLATGQVAPGANMVVGDIAQDLDLSPTPVREALVRLAGEGLIEDRRGKGYFAWPLGAADISELYQTHQAYLRIALETWAAHGALSASSGLAASSEPPSCAAVFDQIVRSSGNRILWEDYRHLTERMARVRLVESVVLRNVEAESAGLRQALDGSDLEALKTAIDAYHARRLQCSGVVAGAIADGNYR